MSTLPQSAAQQRLWLTWQIDPQSAAYNIPGGLRLRGELDEAALRASFQRLVERHEALRTRFLERDGAALQRIDERGEFAWQFVDLAALAEHERAAAAAQRREAEAQQPFDLKRGRCCGSAWCAWTNRSTSSGSPCITSSPMVGR